MEIVFQAEDGLAFFSCSTLSLNNPEASAETMFPMLAGMAPRL
jgi:hypothetical protein